MIRHYVLLESSETVIKYRWLFIPCKETHRVLGEAASENPIDMVSYHRRKIEKGERTYRCSSAHYQFSADLGLTIYILFKTEPLVM
jgi:hypothetical protein